MKIGIGQLGLESLFYGMEPKYATLRTVYELVKNEANLLTYVCFPTQIILRQTQPWDAVMQQLNELANEGYISIQQPGTTICMTERGVEKATAGVGVL